MSSYSLTSSELATYQNDGFCVVASLLSVDALAAVYSLLDEAKSLVARGEVSKSWQTDMTAWERDLTCDSLIVRKVPAPFEHSEQFRSIFSSPVILDRVEQLIGSEIFLHSSKLIFKPPQIGRRKPLHQDLAYWDDMQAPQITVWCAIDSATPENGCLEVIPRSHKKGLIPHADLEDWQINEHTLEDKAVCIPMNAGDVMFLDVLTIHASLANRSNCGRLAAIVNYYSEPRRSDQRSKYGSETPLRTRSLLSAKALLHD
ncbi:phytanoyl-CoA dioxygenase family protein [Nostoc sp. CHAB 5784]|uniref:phytanoyl-CoA dioxygenase family protein n=1 Tax=Nostoc mirabile TaxID=2907820 RepID=UPI001E51595B|nr:phytanoyl-CoA dioxygenase family protein [Nostoc mirabile]MCC5669481.1 phytanoyl-CoA dioxygenase family protein [Nostoc mirabile CHAB5784]